MSDDLSTASSDGLNADDAYSPHIQLRRLSQGPPGSERGGYYRFKGKIAPQDAPRFRDWISDAEEARRAASAKKQAIQPPPLSRPYPSPSNESRGSGDSPKAKAAGTSSRHPPTSHLRAAIIIPDHVRKELERDAAVMSPVPPPVPSSIGHNSDSLSRHDPRFLRHPSNSGGRDLNDALGRERVWSTDEPGVVFYMGSSSSSSDSDWGTPPRDPMDMQSVRFRSSPQTGHLSGGKGDGPTAGWIPPPDEYVRTSKRRRPDSWSSNSSNGDSASKPTEQKRISQISPHLMHNGGASSGPANDAKKASRRQKSSDSARRKVNANTGASDVKPLKSALKPTSGVPRKPAPSVFGYPAAAPAPGYIPRFIPPPTDFQGLPNIIPAASISRDSGNGLVPPPRSPSPFASSSFARPIGAGTHPMYPGSVHPLLSEAVTTNHYPALRNTFSAIPTYGGRPVSDPYWSQYPHADPHHPALRFRPPMAGVPAPLSHGYEPTFEAKEKPMRSSPDKWKTAKTRRLYDTERDPHTLDPQRTSLQTNPILCCSNGEGYPLIVDLSNKRKHVASVEKPDTRWRDEDVLDQPATLPRVTRLRVISPKTLGPIEITNRGGVTVRDVLRNLFKYFNEPISWREFQGFSKRRQYELNVAYFANAGKRKGKPHHVSKTVRRVDMLGEEPLFDGLHSDPDQVSEYMGESDVATLVMDFKSRMLMG